MLDVYGPSINARQDLCIFRTGHDIIRRNRNNIVTIFTTYRISEAKFLIFGCHYLLPLQRKFIYMQFLYCWFRYINATLVLKTLGITKQYLHHTLFILFTKFTEGKANSFIDIL